MQQLIDFLARNFIWLFLFTFSWIGVGIAWKFYRHKKRGLVVPPIMPGDVKFHESSASGFSHKSLYTQMGGASRCMLITVTDAEVWIRTNFPFSLFSEQYDLEHRISKSAITNVQQTESRDGSLLLDFSDAQGKIHRRKSVV